jgi:hypothetical protein
VNRIRKAALWSAAVFVVGGGTAAFVLTGGPGSPFASAESVRLQGRSVTPSTVTRTSIAWCGTDAAADDRLPDAVGGQQIHVIYAFPSDGTDRFSTLAGPIASDAEAMDVWWRKQDSSRTLRFDLFAFPGCPPGLGQLDISRVQLPQPTSYYFSSATRMSRVVTDLDATFADPAKKYLVYFDGAVDEPRLCGQSIVSPDQGGRYAYSVVYAQACRADIGTGAITADVAVHELTHNLGAVPPGAPHACPGDSAHVCDDENDLMYPYTKGQGLSAVALDIGHDDYYAHGQAWWDLRNSAWLTHLDAPQYPLNVSFGTSSGRGTVTSDLPGIACPPGCSAPWNSGASLTLTAVPADGSRFVGWSGACTSDPCTVLMNTLQTAVALFAAQVKVTVVVRHTAGKSGTVTSRPAGISCPPTCSTTLDQGTRIRLVATAGNRSAFTGWGGTCTGKTSCVFAAGSDAVVTAAFAAPQPFEPPARKVPLCKKGQKPTKAKPCRRR